MLQHVLDLGAHQSDFTAVGFKVGFVQVGFERLQDGCLIGCNGVQQCLELAGAERDLPGGAGAEKRALTLQNVADGVGRCCHSWVIARQAVCIVRDAFGLHYAYGYTQIYRGD